MSIPGGYILQPRLFYKSDAAHLPPCTREVWAYVLSSVNHTDGKQFKRGQGFFKFPDIQNALHWYVGNSRRTYSKPQISKAFGRLSEETMLETRKATRGIVVTILNYEYYQDPTNYVGNAEESPKRVGSACDGGTISKEVKNVRTKKDLKTFVRPTLEDLQNYCQEKAYTFDPENYIAFYESNGWKVGRNPMKSWKAACTTWQKREKGNGKASQPILSNSTQAGVRALQRIREEEQNGQLAIGQGSDEDF